jgi:hypothetical protein
MSTEPANGRADVRAARAVYAKTAVAIIAKTTTTTDAVSPRRAPAYDGCHCCARATSKEAIF